MSEKLSKGSQRVQSLLEEYGLELNIVEFTESTRTAKDAAEAIGCQLGQIAKTLIFRCKGSGEPLCVIASGINRVDEKKLKSYVGEKIEKPDASYVLENTGYAIGGVAPIGHKKSMVIFIDEDLLGYSEIWAAAGSPNTVFKLTPDDLIRITGGRVLEVKNT
jgi:Cys-tRNA(Pro) deacylase